MKWQTLTTKLAIVVSLVWIGAICRPLQAQPNPASTPNTLNNDLSQAVCQQDWARAIRIVDRMRGISPADRRGELTVYRSRLQAMLNSQTVIPGFQCASGGTTSSPTPRTTARPSP